MGKQKFSLQGRSAVDGPTGSGHGFGRQSGSGHSDRRQARRRGGKCMPMAEAAPAPPKVAAPAQPRVVEQKTVEKKVDGKEAGRLRIDDILSAEDDDLPGGLDDLDLGDDLGAVTSPNSPTTKACPDCGEQILAVAVKCKHCGSYVGQKAQKLSPGSRTTTTLRREACRARLGDRRSLAVAVVVVSPCSYFRRLDNVSALSRAACFTCSRTGGSFAARCACRPSALLTPPAYKPTPEEVAFAGKLVAFWMAATNS